MLSRIRHWLEPRDQLHLVVPNATSLHRRIGVAMGMLDRPNSLCERACKYGHNRIYDEKLLGEHLDLAGWSVERVKGVFLKPMSNAQTTAFAPKLLEAFFKVGQERSDYCAELYDVAHNG
jgi:hypothetical protein